MVHEEVRDNYPQASHQGFSALTWRHEQDPQEPQRSRWLQEKGAEQSAWLTLVTSTAFLGSWVLEPIEDMTSLGTDFEMHNNWQGYVEAPPAKDFVPRKVHTIALSKVQGTHWNAIKCKSTWAIVQKLSSDKQQSIFIQEFGNPLSIPCPSCTELT